MGNDHFESLRHLGGKYWQRIVTALTAILACIKIFYDISNNSPKVQTAVVLAVALFIIIVIRFPSVAIRLTRWILGQPPLLPNPPRIFRGPLPYLDSERLPGRAAEINSCWLLIQRQPFFILEGESGCGKTSILNAALIPLARERFRVVECRIASDPIGKLCAALQQSPYQLVSQADVQPKLGEAMAGAKTTYTTSSDKSDLTKPLLICIDQFEELFVTVKDTVRSHFLIALKKAIANGETRLVIAVRSDFRDLLLGLCRAADEEQQTLNLGSYYTLPAFSSRQAKAVLNELLEPIHQQDPLRQQQLDDFSTQLVRELLLPPRDRRLCREDEKTVLPVELQTVGLMIESVGIENFSAHGITRLGGKAGLFRAYIEEAKSYVWRKTGVLGDQSLLILRQLISPAQTKWTQTSLAVAKALKLPAAQVESVLKAFAEKFLVNQLPPEDSPDGKRGSTVLRYELLHEHLVNILVEAPEPILQRARDAEERLQFWRKRTGKLFSPRGRGMLASILIQPIPATEMRRLWRFATDDELKRMLRRNLRGFCFRLLFSLVIPISLALVGWDIWTRSDLYQIQQVIKHSPITQAIAVNEEVRERLFQYDEKTQVASFTQTITDEEPLETKWVKALIYAGWTDAAFAVLRNMKDPGDRSEGFAVATISLSKVNDLEAAKIALETSLIDEQESWWHDIHSESVATFVEATVKVDKYDQSGIFSLIKGEKNRARALAAVATGLFRAGRLNEANKAFAEALKNANRINDSGEHSDLLEERTEVLVDIAEEAMASKRISDAMKALNEASSTVNDANLGDKDSGERFDLLSEIANDYVELSNVDGAEQSIRELVASNWRGWDTRDIERIEIVIERLAKEGKTQEILALTHDAQLKPDKQWVLVASATGLARAGDIDNTLTIVKKIKDLDNKLDALAGAACELLNKSEVHGAIQLMNQFRLLQPQTTSKEVPKVPSKTYELLDKLIKSGQRDIALAVSRSYELRFASAPQTWRLMTPPNMRRSMPISPLSKTAATLIDVGNIDDGINLAREVQDRYGKYYVLAEAAAAQIKLNRFEQARGLEAEMLLQSEDTSATSGLEMGEPDDSLMNIAAEWIKVGRIDEARNLLQQALDGDNRNEGLTFLAMKLIESGKLDEAFDIVNTLNNAVHRSKALADMTLKVIEENKGERAQSILPLIQYPSDQSRACAAVSQWQARNGLIRAARLTADTCSSPRDQIEAYTTILVEYAKRRRPELRKEFDKEKSLSHDNEK
jgi:tetratricopeptide (TPR) repeat protein